MARSRRTDDPAEDVGAAPELLGEAVEELGVMGVALAARPPVLADPEPEGAAEATVDAHRELRVPRQPTEVEALEVDGVAEGVLADATPATARPAAVVGPAVDHSGGWTAVVGGRQIDHHLLETLEPLAELRVDSNVVSEGLAAPMNQGVGGTAIHSFALLEEAWGGVERMMVVRPTVEEREVRPTVGRRGEREHEDQQDEGQTDHDVLWGRARERKGSLRSGKIAVEPKVPPAGPIRLPLSCFHY